MRLRNAAEQKCTKSCCEVLDTHVHVSMHKTVCVCMRVWHQYAVGSEHRERLCFFECKVPGPLESGGREARVEGCWQRQGYSPEFCMDGAV